jgi:hypothetical protein
MRDPAPFWQRKRRSLEKAWKVFRRDVPDGARDLVDVLDRLGTAARAAGHRGLARRARRIRRRIRKVATLQSHRELLSRLRRLGFLPPEAGAGLDARWEELSRERGRRALRKARGRPFRRLDRALERRERAGQRGLARKLETAWRRRAQRLEPPGAQASRRDLDRYRATVRRARDLALALSEAGGTLPAAAERDQRACDALDRWHDLGVFRRLLARERKGAERRGVVTLALELDGLISALDRSLEKARREALTAARATSNVVAFSRQSA